MLEAEKGPESVDTLMEGERMYLGSFLDRPAMTRLLDLEEDNMDTLQSKVRITLHYAISYFSYRSLLTRIRIQYFAIFRIQIQILLSKKYQNKRKNLNLITVCSRSS